LLVGAQRLEAKVAQYRPGWVAVLTIGEYRRAFGRPRAQVGPQEETIAGSRLWLLPNPSGLNAHYTPTALGSLFREFREAVEAG
jgi:double-stranded uracil-DNA glycosylase